MRSSFESCSFSFPSLYIMISFTLKIPHALAIIAIFLVLFSNVFSSFNDESGTATDVAHIIRDVS